MDEQQQRIFLDEIARGSSVSRACDFAGVERWWPYLLRSRKSPDGKRFNARWIEARRRRLDVELMRAGGAR